MPLGSLIGGIMSQGANSAAGSQASAAGGQALANSRQVGYEDVARLSPWIQSGSAAADQINQLLGLGHLQVNTGPSGGFGIDNSNWQGDQANAFSKFRTDPGYQFRFNQGQQAVQNSAAARGNTFSGAQAKALTDYGQNAGSAEYGNYFNRLAGVSGQGQGAASSANQSFNQAVIPGINDAFQGQLAQGQYNVAGQNAFNAGLLGAQNSLVSLAGYGLGGGFGGLTQGGGLGAGGAQVPGGITGNAPGGYSYPPYNIA